MKAKHRHELHTNWLADHVGRFIESLKGGSQAQASVLVWVFAILALATYALWQYSATAGQSERSAQWVALGDAVRDFASGDTRLDELAKTGKGTLPGRGARFEVARLALQFGQENLRSFRRADATKKLLKARSDYEELSRECVDNPGLLQEALMGVATAEESLIGVADPDDPEKICGNLDRAVGYYSKLADDFPDSPLGKKARERLDYISANRPKVEEFYAAMNRLAAPKAKAESPPPVPTPIPDVKAPPETQSGTPKPSLPPVKTSPASNVKPPLPVPDSPPVSPPPKKK
jgi:hypothetical protein